MQKVIYVIAGLNGCGKTTFAETILASHYPGLVYLNPDLIAQGLGANFEVSSIKAGKILLTSINNKIVKGESFAFESTLSGLTYSSILTSAQNLGYKIVIYFLYVKNIAINIKRIQIRVNQGGHFIPTETVKRRYQRCFKNFWAIYRPLANEWYILNNTQKSPKLIMSSDHYENLDSAAQIDFEKKFIGGLHED